MRSVMRSKWDEFLAGGKESYFVLCCRDRQEAFAIPYSWVKEHKKDLNMTVTGDGAYWHFAVATTEGGQLAVNVSKIGMKAPL